jgi:hypothetical protein
VPEKDVHLTLSARSRHGTVKHPAASPELRENGYRPGVVLVFSRGGCDYGSLIRDSGARGFIAKAELSGPAVAALVE